MKKWIVVAIILIFMIGCFSGCVKNTKTPTPSKKVSSETEVSIACWNLQNFGQEKADNEELVDYYCSKINDYDVAILQGIMDNTSNAIQKISNEIKEYKYIVSERAGKNNTTKQQYAIFYSNKVTLVDTHDYTLEQQMNITRPPLKATFRVGDWTFDVLTFRANYSSVAFDLYYVEKIVKNSLNDTVIIGDLGVDGLYYNENNIQHFKDWTWVIPNSADTYIDGNFTYDRIIINRPCLDNFVSYGIMTQVSQTYHYLIYAIFDITI